MTVLISAAELRRQLSDPAASNGDDNAATALRLLDVRWALDAPDGLPAFLEAHIPGAVYVSLDEELAAHGEPTDGRHPLPARDSLQAAARAWGLNDGDSVVVYDARSTYGAARAWWQLRHAGVADVRILDGGFDAWTDAGYETEAGSVAAEPGDVELGWGLMPVIDAEGAAAFPASGQLLDARAGERYRGEIEPLDPKAGHIPGAISVPTAGNVGPDGRFLPAEELRARFEALGVSEGESLAVYCGSGVSAAHQIAALAIAGFDAALYPGSWSQWSNMDLPVETGDGQRVAS